MLKINQNDAFLIQYMQFFNFLKLKNVTFTLFIPMNSDCFVRIFECFIAEICMFM